MTTTTAPSSGSADTRRNTLMFVDGTFEELAREMADFLSIGDELAPLIEKGQKDEVLKRLVVASPALHTMTEAIFAPAYNLLVYLTLESPNAKIFLPKICDHLCTKPVSSSHVNGPQLALFVLQNIFNLLKEDSELRFHAYSAILRFVREHNMFEVLKDSTNQLPQWLQQWKVKPAEQRSLYIRIADAAASSAEEEVDVEQSKANEDIAFRMLLNALSLCNTAEVASEEATKLAVRIVRMALLSNHKFLMNDLMQQAAIQALADSEPEYFQLLEIFCGNTVDDYVSFVEEHAKFLEQEKLDGEKLKEKMRLLTFASLAAQASSGKREIQYQEIATALQVPQDEAEMWAIDAIRAQLVEGKLNQKSQTFGVHRATYRVFGDRQWRELATRLGNWHRLLTRVAKTLDKGVDEITHS